LFHTLLEHITATPLWCLNTGEKWLDARDMQTLIDIGATKLCNGGGIKAGSRITNEERETFTVIAIGTFIIASRMRGR
jgi:hypothetical protein